MSKVDEMRACLLTVNRPTRKDISLLLDYVEADEAIREVENRRRIPHQGMWARLEDARRALGLETK